MKASDVTSLKQTRDRLNLSDEDCNNLKNALLSKGWLSMDETTLTVKDRFNDELNDGSLTDAEAKQILDYIAAFPNTLTSVHLEKVEPREEAKTQWLKNLGYAIQSQQKLKTVTLQNIDIRDSEMATLVYSLRTLPELETLDLSDNYIADKGANTIATPLQYSSRNSLFPKLEKLDLRNNHIEDKGAEPLLSVMRKKTCPLVELALSGNPCQYDKKWTVTRAAQNNLATTTIAAEKPDNRFAAAIREERSRNDSAPQKEETASPSSAPAKQPWAEKAAKVSAPISL